jgi:hypothetical protein
MHQENEKQLTVCTTEYCVKPGVNDSQPARPVSEMIILVNAAMLERNTWVSVPKQD